MIPGIITLMAGAIDRIVENEEKDTTNRRKRSSEEWERWAKGSRIISDEGEGEWIESDTHMDLEKMR